MRATRPSPSIALRIFWLTTFISAALVASLREQNAAYRQQIHGGFGQVAQALIKNPNDLAAAEAIIDQQTAAETAMKKNAIAAASKALQVLTPEQRDHLGTLVTERLQRIEGRRSFLR